MVDFLRSDAEVAKAAEPGTLRFDVWESADEPDAVYFDEAYVDQAAFAAHTEGEPLKQFIAEIVPELAEAPTFVVPFTQSVVSSADR